MSQREWIEPSLVLTGLSTSKVEDLVQFVSERLAEAAGTDLVSIRDAFLGALGREGFSIGEGIGIPHVEVSGLSETRVCLVILNEPLPLSSMDGKPLDIFFFILAKPDPQAHLLLLAHLARLTQSRVFLDGLRRAQSPAEVIELLRAAEARIAGTDKSAMPAVSRSLILVSISGEKAVDALLVALVDQGFGDASLLESQSLREAAAREIPLFAGFRDIFGDPGGRRMFIVETAAEQVDAVVDLAARACHENGAKDAWVSVLPVQRQWMLCRPAKDEAAGGS